MAPPNLLAFAKAAKKEKEAASVSMISYLKCFYIKQYITNNSKSQHRDFINVEFHFKNSL